ncbi:MAG: hypothetical protein ACTHWB_09015 [Microbacterium gubbeenense]|uniref:hypothetical protein n=1 Tax=Microbacterium gubbeenense TaxID=159896 RepID=UPI003F9D8A51
MTNPILLAEEADEQEFFAAYDPSVTPMYQSDAVGETVLFGSVFNPDPDARTAITNRLLDDGADPSVVTRSGTTVLHVLLTNPDLEPESDAHLLRRLLAGGAPINRVDSKRGAPLAILFDNYTLEDDEAEPLYEAFFERPDLDLEARGNMGLRTVRESIEMAAEKRPIPYRMMIDYDKRKNDVDE